MKIKYQAELNRRGVYLTDQANPDERFIEKKQMFSNYGFNDKQLNGDARVRIEQRLREAGLINSDYARAVFMNNFKSDQTAQKRDLRANSKWNGFGMDG